MFPGLWQVKCQACYRRFHRACVSGLCDVCAQTVSKPGLVSTASKSATKATKKQYRRNSSEHYSCHLLSKRVKRCQGCRQPFNHDSERLVLSRYESHPYYRPGHGQRISSRNFYYHMMVACIKIANASPVLRVKLDTPVPDIVRRCLLGEGFDIV